MNKSLSFDSDSFPTESGISSSVRSPPKPPAGLRGPPAPPSRGPIAPRSITTPPLIAPAPRARGPVPPNARGAPRPPGGKATPARPGRGPPAPQSRGTPAPPSRGPPGRGLAVPPPGRGIPGSGRPPPGRGRPGHVRPPPASFSDPSKLNSSPLDEHLLGHGLGKTTSRRSNLIKFQRRMSRMGTVEMSIKSHASKDSQN